MSAVGEIRQYKTGKFYRDEYRGKLSWNGNEHNVLLRGEGVSADGTPRFADVAMALGADDVQDARGMAVADIDHDGDLDIIINTHPGDHGVISTPPVLLRNNLGHHRNWVAIKLTGTKSNRDAIGAQVILELEGADGKPLKLMRHVTAGGGYASQNSDRLYFGLGNRSRIASLTVRWPSGQIQEFEDVDGNCLYQLTELGKLEAQILPAMSKEIAFTPL